jgi:hypothetical protein
MVELKCGDRVVNNKAPEWGLGQILHIAEMEVSVYFVWAKEKKLHPKCISKVEGEKARSEVLDTLAHVNLKNAYHNVYVVELNNDVLKEPVFRKANPDRDPNKPCVYVGETGLPVEERFDRHLLGIQSGRGYVENYGEQLLYDLFEYLNPLPYYLAKVMEVELARKLRSEGYAVWQN